MSNAQSQSAPAPTEEDVEQRFEEHLTVWVLAGSPEWHLEGVLERVPNPDYIVAADGGSRLATHLGVTPSLLIGDLDSAERSVIERWAAEGVQTERYEHATKLETDTELALIAAMRWLGERPGTIYILNAIGGRLDHTLANVFLLTHPGAREFDVRLIDGHHEVFVAKPGIWNAITGSTNDLVTLLPVGGDVSGVTLQGLVYPLYDDLLAQGRGRGVSNQIGEPPARVRFERGLLLVIVTHDK